MLYLVCHGTLLRDDSGRRASPTCGWSGRTGPPSASPGRRPGAALQDLPRRPVLVVLAACQSAGRPHEAGALAAVGPALAAAGVGAVVAMQGDADAGHRRAPPARLLRRAAPRRARRPGPGRGAGGRARPAGLVGARALPAPARRAPVGRAARPAGPVALADARARRNRERMLARVRKTWIAGGAGAPRCTGPPCRPWAWRSSPSAVPDRWGPLVQEAGAASARPRSRRGRPSPTCSTHFDGELLLLGEPGAGKTTLLLELARTLLDRAEQDEALPIPVVSRSPPGRRAARRWRSGWWRSWPSGTTCPRAVAAAWVADEQDPAPAGRPGRGARPGTARRAWRPSTPSARAVATGLASLAVCCRAADYLALATQLRLRGAVLLQPARRRRRWTPTWPAPARSSPALRRGAAARTPALRELATSPLLLQPDGPDLPATPRRRPCPGGGAPRPDGPRSSRPTSSACSPAGGRTRATRGGRRCAGWPGWPAR